MESKLFSEVAVLCIDGNKGIYQAQELCKKFSYSKQVNSDLISEEDYNILLYGPDHADYFDVWGDTLEFISVLIDGEWWNVTQLEGDIWLIPDSMPFEIENDIC